MTKPLVKQVIFEQECYSETWPLEKFIRQMERLYISIPPKLRKSACVEIISEGGWEGSHSAQIMVSYYRPERAAETADRKRRHRAQEEGQKARELQLLAELSAKYGPHS